MRLNRPPPSPRTHEGAPAVPVSAEKELRRAVASCLLWENEFYENGVAIADRIANLVTRVSPAFVADLAVEARESMNLRHAPLWLLAALSRAGSIAAFPVEHYPRVFRRADEPGEFLAMLWKDGKRPLAKSIKRGLALAFSRFDAYQLGKYNRDSAVKLRDVLRLVHPKPADEAQSALWQSVIDGTLSAPDTWEVALSGGADKRETFERLIEGGKLGYLALLRNLRGMMDAGVDDRLIRDAIIARKGAHNVLPFRYVAAARAAPRFEPAIDEALCAAVEGLPILPGRTAVLVDVSQSMNAKLSAKSDMTRMDAACALAAIIHGDVRMFTFSQALVEVPPRRGMAGVDALRRSQPHHNTYLGAAVTRLQAEVPHDRLIVITDEESHDAVPSPKERGYMIKVNATRNAVGFGPWTRVEGFSENVIRYIVEHESDVG